MADLLSALLGSSKSVSFDSLLQSFFNRSQSKSGQYINHVSALKVTTSLACCRVLSEGVAQIPLKLRKERKDEGSDPAKDHSLYRVLYRKPNEWMTSFEWRETMMYHAILLKGGFSIINRVRGQIRELIPVTPDRVTIITNTDTGNVSYSVLMPDGTQQPIARNQMFHLRGPSWNGIEGMEVIELAREALGLAIATEETHASFHKNGAKTGGIISFDGPASEQTIDRVKKAFSSAVTGNSAYKTAVLDGGAKYQQMSMTGVDAQHIETRKFQIEEVCRALRVFPQMVGHSDKTSTFASAEQFFIAHVVHSLGPWIERFEQAIDRDLLTEKELDDGYFSKFSVQGLLRGDSSARASYFTSLYNIGAINPNEIRALDDMNPYKGGDTYRVPLNMTDPTNENNQGGASSAPPLR